MVQVQEPAREHLPGASPRAPARSSLSGPALIRLITRLTGSAVAEAGVRLTGSAVAEPRVSLSDRLSQWLGWADAITLSTVLGSALPAAPAAKAAAGNAAGPEDVRQECARLRAGLLAAIGNDGKRPAGREPDRRLRAQPLAKQVEADYPVHGQRYVTLQQTMESDIGQLRARLRTMLATRSPEMTRLAMLDALMERTLAPRERALLATLPGLLEKHFERLRQDGAQDAAGAWLDVFRQDMRSVLRAELEVRLQPIEGLLAALLQPQQQAEQNSTQ